MDVLLCVNDSCGLNNCYSIKCNKQQEKYCFSRANIFTSGDIELNPGPANAYMLLQSRLAQQEGILYTHASIWAVEGPQRHFL